MDWSFVKHIPFMHVIVYAPGMQLYTLKVFLCMVVLVMYNKVN